MQNIQNGSGDGALNGHPMAARQSTDEHLLRCIAKIDRQCIVTQRVLLEMRDDPNRHLHWCACKRHETRFDFCFECLKDSMVIL